jgi:tRNA nucleotidyltransferase/poly(A) polymerase
MKIENKFFKALPQEVSKLVEVLNQQGLLVGFIGGIARDFLIDEKMGTDFDCEVRPVEDIDLSAKWKELQQHLTDTGYKVKKLAYEILRVSGDEWEVELTYPRIETYTGEKGHSNFTATFVRDADYSQGFNRRDFTLNAIMFEKYQEVERLIDPLGGVGHLEQKELWTCSEDFVQDPVRFLRAVRFKNNFDLVYSEELQEKMQQQPLKGLSSHYFMNELKKCHNPLEMFLEICELRPELVEDANQFVEYQDQLIKLHQHTDDGLEGLLQSLCWGFNIDHESRKRLITSLGLSLKKYPCMLEHDFTNLKLKELKDINSFIKDEKFVEFTQWLGHVFKWELKDDFLSYLFQCFNLNEFTVSEFYRLKEMNLQLTSEEKATYTPTELNFVLMAKKYLAL